MTLPIVQLATSGFKIVVHVKDPAGNARNLTGATNLKVAIKSAVALQGKEFEGTAENLAEGQISYTIAEDDVDAIGDWEAHAYYELGAWKGWTKREPAFTVEANLVESEA